MGWPKGVPRKPKPSPELIPAADVGSPEPRGYGQGAATLPYEPVSVKATLLSGKEVDFRAITFDVVSGRYTFISYPPERGFKTVRVLRWDQLAMLEITGPESECDKLKEWVPPPVVNAMAAVTPPSGPVHFGNAHAAAIRQANLSGAPLPSPPADPRVPSAVGIPNAPGIPMSRISAGDEGRPEIVGASLMP